MREGTDEKHHKVPVSPRVVPAPRLDRPSSIRLRRSPRVASPQPSEGGRAVVVSERQHIKQDVKRGSVGRCVLRSPEQSPVMVSYAQQAAPAMPPQQTTEGALQMAMATRAAQQHQSTARLVQHQATDAQPWGRGEMPGHRSACRPQSPPPADRQPSACRPQSPPQADRHPSVCRPQSPPQPERSRDQQRSVSRLQSPPRADMCDQRRHRSVCRPLSPPLPDRHTGPFPQPSSGWADWSANAQGMRQRSCGELSCHPPPASAGKLQEQQPQWTAKASASGSATPTSGSDGHRASSGASLASLSRRARTGSAHIPLASSSSDPTAKARDLVSMALSENLQIRRMGSTFTVTYRDANANRQPILETSTIQDAGSEKAAAAAKTADRRGAEASDRGGLSRSAGAVGTRPPFPTTGRPISVKFVCGCSDVPSAIVVSSFQGHRITSDWEHRHLLQVSELSTGVHRDAQKIFHAGREITPGCTIRAAIGVHEDQLPSRCAVHVLVDRESFPQRLGPFSLIKVPVKSSDFILPMSVEGGFHWTMRTEVLERQGLRSDGPHVTAQCSPTHPITLSDEERALADIPPEAVEFAWSYPMARWEQVAQDPHVLDDWASCQQGDPPLKDFLVVGGFVYLDEDHRIVRVTTPRDNKAEQGGLHFGAPKKWHHAWTKALLGDGRFQRVTIGPLKDAGVHFFCWLRPGERFVGEDMRPLAIQPQVPHGGFVYLFHELGNCAPQVCAVDCYFPVLRIHSQMSASLSTSFKIVGQEDIGRTDLVGHTTAQLHVHSMSLEDA